MNNEKANRVKSEKIEIDILQMELEQKLPHWLDWTQQNPDKVKAIREKNRAKWLAEQKKKNDQKRAWQKLSADEQEQAKQFWISASFKEFSDSEHPPSSVLEQMDDYWASTLSDHEKFRAWEMRAGDWDESLHPRDERGRFGEGGGGDGGSGAAPAAEGGGKGSGKHPGKGYSKNAYVDDKGVIQTSDVQDAARALGENRRVHLDQPRGISTLLKELGRVSKEMIAKGEKAPTYNLCNVSVSGTNLFCVDTKGIPRIEMPQLDDEQTKEFRKYLKNKGYELAKEKVSAANLRATQNELNGVKVAGIAEHLKDKPDHHGKRLIISRDDYILDGHHHWAAKVGLDSEDGILTNDTKMRITRVDISIVELLEEAEKFTGGKGKKGAEETTTGKHFPTTILADLVHEQMAGPKWHEWRALKARSLQLLADLWKK